MGTGAQHTDFLALEFGQRVLDVAAFLHHEARRGVVVLDGEIDVLLAVVSDGHGRQDGVDFLDLQRRDQAVELLFDPGALGFHLLAQRIADIHVETGEFAVRGFHREWRVAGFDTDANRLGVFGHGGQGQHRQCQGTEHH
ncbi:hypothetical protein D9M69_527000 [compost metagenome]